jgi:hypothetical protein
VLSSFLAPRCVRIAAKTLVSRSELLLTIIYRHAIIGPVCVTVLTTPQHHPHISFFVFFPTTDFITIENVLNGLAGNDSSFDPKTVSIMSPCFLDKADYESGAGNASNLYWSSTGWFTGRTASGPVTVEVDGDETKDGTAAENGDGNEGEEGSEVEGDATTAVRKREQVDSGATSISSFDVLDNLANHYMDKDTYPNLKVSSVAFFSR